MPRELDGWLLSVYADETDGAVVWLLGEDGKRYRLTQPFETTFYVSGDEARLKDIRKELGTRAPPPKSLSVNCARGGVPAAEACTAVSHPVSGRHPHGADGRRAASSRGTNGERSRSDSGLSIFRTKMTFLTRQDLYKGMLPVLAVRVENPVAQQRLFHHMKKTFKWVRYFDAEIPFPIRYGVTKKVFPMARCRVQIDEPDRILEIEALDSPWDTVYDLPPLRSLLIEPDADPQHAAPTRLDVQYEGILVTLSLSDEAGLLAGLQRILDEYDPDVIFARWGDGWLFPFLIESARKHGIEFNPSRDPRQKYRFIQESTFESYGSIYFRAQQTHLFGRWHIDPRNSTMDMGFKFSMRSAIEMARVTGVDVQTAARNSPGSGFTAMQIREALRRGILIPSQKRQTERFKSALELNAADGGGLNYRPVVGLHKHVAELDFFSMYPSIMMTWNISGETVGVEGVKTRYVPNSGAPITLDVDGLVASVLRPLLGKRLAVKRAMKRLAEDDPQRAVLQSVADALKWLGYVSFGYQGYKNNLFGNIQAHEAICAVGRETLVTSIETAQEMGFKVLGANVDSLFVHKEGASRPRDFGPLMDEIMARTGLVIEFEGIFDWLVFTASKLNPRIGAANRYFGRFDHGGLKVRGLAQRRTDSCNWIADAEREILSLLGGEPDPARLPDLIPQAIALIRAFFDDLDAERVPVEDLVCQTKLSREPHEYKGNSTSAKAAWQLAAEGKRPRVGQRVKFVYTHGEKTSIFAWDLVLEPGYSLISKLRYKELLLRTVHQILGPLGIEDADLASLVHEDCRQLALWPGEEIWEEDEIDNVVDM
jgi:DNA polymerase elongation subunit (family B)